MSENTENQTDAEALAAVTDQLEVLKQRATLMGIQFHPSIGIDKLREKITAALEAENNPPANDDTSIVGAPVAVVAAKETPEQRRLRARQEAAALIRIRVVCMNPNKKEWEGEIITAGNAAVGTFKKYVPFNADDGWHVPHIIYEQLLHRECQTFVAAKDTRGNTIRRPRMIKEFAIEVLPMLSEKELTELARRQAMAKSVD